MRLSELKGIKSSAEYKAFQSEKYMRDLKNKLNDLGYRQYFLDSGLYGAVWARPGENFVVKIFKEDSGYEKYIDFIKKFGSSPYAPKIKGSLVKLPNDYKLIRLEKLRPQEESDYEIYHELDVLLSTHQSYRNESLIKFIEKYPGIDTFVNELKKFKKEDSYIGMDIHSDNIMMRGNIPVITDPFVGKL